LSYDPDRTQHVTRRGYARFSAPGVYATTVTHPAEFRAYLLDQLTPLVEDYGATMEVGVSEQEIPYPYALQGGDELARGGVTAQELARHFPVPLLSTIGDEIADGTFDLSGPEPRPLSLFDAVRTDYSLRRLIHYTGTDWRGFQRWILLTNYHRYVDQFVRHGIEMIRSGEAERLVAPGGLVIDARSADESALARLAAAPWHRFQMPAYHLQRAGHAGITMITIGGGPANAKTISITASFGAGKANATGILRATGNSSTAGRQCRVTVGGQSAVVTVAVGIPIVSIPFTLDGSGNLTITVAPESPSTFANISGFEFEFN
jgi:AMP nucleosidase